MSPPPTITKQTVLTGFTTPTDTTNVLKQLRAAAALAAKKQQEAEEASRRAAEDLQRGEEEAKAKAEEEEESRRRAAEKKLAEMDKKKTGTRARRCTGCTKTKFDTPCTFSATSSSITSCDRCRRLKIACTFTGEAEKSRRKKRMVDEVESPRRGKGKKKSRHQSLSPSPMEIEEEADEMTPAVAAMQMMADKIGQLTELVCQVNNAMTEEFAAHRKELHRMVTALDHLLEYRDELVTTESIKQE
ncbi:hypothetical protein P692DRAFT_20827178 [Suillus brevipes Sb2]|nr:hypothetical protein P692DRAFT_20827178 [Suillus brevipes Sb2]